MQEEQKTPETRTDSSDQSVRLAGKIIATARSSEDELHHYPDNVKLTVTKLAELYNSLIMSAAVLHKDDTIGGGRKAELELKFLAERAEEICREITMPTSKTPAEQEAVARELWNIIKLTPKSVADATGYTLEQLVHPEIKGKENHYLPMFRQLAEARDKLQVEYKFKTKLKKSLEVGGVPVLVAGFCAGKLLGVAVGLNPGHSGLTACAAVYAIILLLNKKFPDAPFIGNVTNVLAKNENPDHIAAFDELTKSRQQQVT